MKIIQEKESDISVVDDGSDLVFGFRQFSKSGCYTILKDKLDCIDEVHIGMYYYIHGGCDFEFKVEWILLGDQVAAHVSLYDDCWKHMDQIAPILDMLKTFEGKIPTPNNFVEKLCALGLNDLSRSL
jgi:hypothetical protein